MHADRMTYNHSRRELTPAQAEANKKVRERNWYRRLEHRRMKQNGN